MAHVRKTPTGRYQVRYRDPTGREKARNFKRRIDADRYLISTEADKLNGQWVDPALSRVSFAAWAQQIEATRSNRRPTTRARDDASLRNHVLPFFGPMPIGSIQPAQVRLWLAEMESKGLAPATIQKAYQIVHRLFAVAVDDGRIARTPCRTITLPKVEPTDKRYLTEHEVTTLASAIDPRYRTLILTGAYTGLRIGELAALRVGRVDTLRRTVHVEETMTDVGGRLEPGPPKTRASRRTVSAPAFLVDEIAQLIEPFPDPQQLIFRAPDGGPIRRTNFRRRFWIPAVSNSIGLPCTFHDLRHTHAALLIQAGAHPKVIQERMGHESITTTLDTYGHLLDGLDEAAAGDLDATYRRSHATPDTHEDRGATQQVIQPQRLALS